MTRDALQDRAGHLRDILLVLLQRKFPAAGAVAREHRGFPAIEARDKVVLVLEPVVKKFSDYALGERLSAVDARGGRRTLKVSPKVDWDVMWKIFSELSYVATLNELQDLGEERGLLTPGEQDARERTSRLASSLRYVYSTCF